ncbi:MAG TPA: glycoside hydrolase family 3 protein, partial [Ktedonobacteraceae bacterium]|nr:glycoside hydrolase family 3 protein [Ktedonobacteraceae bacterium]
MHKLHSLLTRQFLFPLFVILLLVSTSFTPLQAFAATHAVRPWMDPSLSPDKRADLLLAQMTLDEKITMLHGTSLGIGLGGYVGHIPANTHLGIPALNLQDGAAGVAGGMTGVTAFPAPVAGAASWDTSLMNQYGQALATEMSGKGANIALSPTVNILRVPQWGRSYESFGEDPYLNSQLGVTEIQGIQSQHIIATVKHLAANNQETDRMSVSAQVDERTLQEIYLPAFHAAVHQGGVGAVMCSYNKVNTIYACEQPYLLHDVLDTQWNFPGFVMSDWYATHSAIEAANAGLDMEMPLGLFYDLPLRVAIGLGQVSMTTINTMVHRILRTMFAFGLFDYPTTGSPGNNVASSAHAQFALQEAEEGTVLLKNDQNILPLDGSKIKSIAVIGADASTSPMIVGGGSASVKAPYVVTPLQGIQKRAGSSISVQYASGSDQKQTAQVASSADVAIVFVNDVEAEGSDRSSLSLPNNQDQLVQTVS